MPEMNYEVIQKWLYLIAQILFIRSIDDLYKFYRGSINSIEALLIL